MKRNQKFLTKDTLNLYFKKEITKVSFKKSPQEQVNKDKGLTLLVFSYPFL